MKCYYENCQTDWNNRSSWTCHTDTTFKHTCDDNQVCEEFKTENLFRKWCASTKYLVTGKDLTELKKTGKVVIPDPEEGPLYRYCNTPLCEENDWHNKGKIYIFY